MTIPKFYFGTTNEIKINAFKKALQLYNIHDYELYMCKVDSLVPNQPKSERSTATGAYNRALGALRNGSRNMFDSECFGVGIESGIREGFNYCGIKKGSKKFEQTIICITDGTNEYFGISPAWEISDTIKQKVFQEHKDLNQVAFECGYTKTMNIGNDIGFVGFITQGVLTREDYTTQGCIFALKDIVKKFTQKE